MLSDNLAALGVRTPEEFRRILDASLRADGPLKGGARPVLLRLDARLLRGRLAR